MSQSHDNHGHGHGSRFIQHHYDNAYHQFDSGKLGIWLFLVQEVLFFSALFVAYIIYRHNRPDIYEYAHHYLDTKMGAINTAVLIFSSLTAAWAVRCAQLNQKRGLILCLATTIICALTFLGVKYVEYSHKIHEGILFGQYFDPCISPAGNHLVTKGNLCEGTKSSVLYKRGGDYSNKQPDGCLEASKIDLDPKAEGIQAECTVTEVKFNANGDIAGSSRAIERCAEGGHGGGHGEPGKGKPAQKFPCWELAANPNICAKGPAVLVLYGDHAKHPGVKIKPECKAPAKADAVDPFADKDLGLPLGQATTNSAKHPKTKHELAHELAMGPPPPNTNMFFSIYFAMTGLHGIHVLAGVFVFIWLLIRATKGHFTSDYFGPIDYAALYWHIVDLIWIFLFPLLYLIH